ncbi:hypothetical protein [Halostella salina]|uniref:hypothetical protein n=1 Tax=Halostella salina TaxID=1547897 RepID=UPI000EF7D669|nr:hypothetical protein [Halostella salina]
MSRWSRRHTLHCCAGLLAAAAGCSDADRSDPPTTSGEAVDGYETHSLRSDGRIVADERDDGPNGRVTLNTLLQSPDHSLRFVAELDGIDAARAFVDETRFGEGSVLVSQGRIGDCYRREVASVSRSDGSFSVDFCDVVRDASVACSEDETAVQATFVRLPFAFENGTESYSVGSGGDCRRAVRPNGGERA